MKCGRSIEQLLHGLFGGCEPLEASGTIAAELKRTEKTNNEQRKQFARDRRRDYKEWTLDTARDGAAAASGSERWGSVAASSDFSSYL